MVVKVLRFIGSKVRASGQKVSEGTEGSEGTTLFPIAPLTG